MMKKVIENVKFIQDGTLVFGDLHLEDGFVERIEYKTPHMESDLALPGFIDIHTHGCMGESGDICDVQRLQELALLYPMVGVTSFCPTISSRSLEAYIPIIKAYQTAFSGAYRGAKFAGLHLEGPYLNPACKGSIKESEIHSIHLSQLEEFLKEYHDVIAIMTIAPEVDHAMEAIRLLHLYGVQVSIGHSNASYEQCVEAFEHGATQITHLGNAMPMIDHHKETMIDAIFLGDCLCELIMDGKHIQKYMLRWLIQLLGVHRICAISDSKYAGSLPPLKQASDENSLNYGYRDMLSTFQFLYKEMQYELLDCIQMCSLNAAKMLKTYIYEIGLGKPIDLVILDHNMNIKDVIINGRSV